MHTSRLQANFNFKKQVSRRNKGGEFCSIAHRLSREEEIPYNGTQQYSGIAATRNDAYYQDHYFTNPVDQNVSEEHLQLKGRISYERRLKIIRIYGTIFPAFCTHSNLPVTDRIGKLNLFKATSSHVSSVTLVTICNICHTFYKCFCGYK
ncbi:unnamed protein product, partial [Dicrocoelium dendriticum]